MVAAVVELVELSSTRSEGDVGPLIAHDELDMVSLSSQAVQLMLKSTVAPGSLTALKVLLMQARYT
jgi:hypothetical protein